MKRIITLIILAVVLMCDAGVVNAQKSKSGRSKSSTSASTPIKTYPKIIDHTYYYRLKGGAAFEFEFVDDQTCHLLMYDPYESYEADCPYTYENGYVKIYDPGVLNTPMFDGRLASDGKTIKLSSGYTMKLKK